MEIRIKDVNLLAEDDGLMKVGGYINVTERESEMLYSKRSGKWFKEVMKKGVFQRAIECAEEIPLLFEHDWNQKLANTRSNTLTLKEDNVGLRFEAVIEDRSVYEKIKAGVINSCSFGFRALKETIEPINSRLEKRYVSGIELLEVSLVSSPAYVGSLAEVRAYEEEVAKEEVVEEITEEVVAEEVRESETDVEEEKETEEETEESEERELEVIHPSEEVKPEIPREVLTEIVNELIDERMAKLQEAEFCETIAQEQLEDVKEYHEEVERQMTEDCMRYNTEVIKMRLQLLKLNLLKEGI